jgi:hypothetical protein
MSAILTMYALGREHLPALEAGGDIPVDHATPVGEDYGYSGYAMLYTLMYLEDERGVEFDSVGEYTLITPAHRNVLDQVDPARNDAAQLGAFLAEELDSDEDDDEALWPHAGVDSLRLLYDQLARLSDDDVLLIQIG